MATEPMSRDMASRGVPRLPQRQILADDVYETIKAMVMDHAIAPGERVNIDALARELRVSQTPVREALARLESESLVVKEPLRGYSTTPLLTEEEFEDLYEFRLLIEPWATARAVVTGTPETHARLIAEMSTCTEAPPGNEYEAYRAIAAHDTRFHDLVAELSGNRRLRLALEHTHCHLHLFRLYYRGGSDAPTLREHQRIVHAIASGDPDAAAAAMRAHLEAARARLRPVFRGLPQAARQARSSTGHAGARTRELDIRKT